MIQIFWLVCLRKEIVCRNTLYFFLISLLYRNLLVVSNVYLLKNGVSSATCKVIHVHLPTSQVKPA
jgi:hypothetical protein